MSICVLAIAGGTLSSPGQVPLDKDTTVAGVLRAAEQWFEVRSYHAVRQELAKIDRHSMSAEQAHQALSLLVQSSFNDHDYEEAYQHSTEFLARYPEDNRADEVQFMQGVSAFHAKRPNAAVASLTRFLDDYPDNEQRAAAYYWRAMSVLDLGDIQGAEDDLAKCFDEPSGIPFRDNALMGWALAFERRGEYALAIEKLERLLSEYPKSELRTDATIRLASVYLRQNNPMKTVELLQTVKPRGDLQRQEYLLLAAEAEFQLGSYERAEFDYASFVREFPRSPHARKARYGLGWSHLKHGDYARARTEFDSLSSGQDSLAYAAMYQSGSLALLEGNSGAATSRFETLVEKSPYDTYVDRSYFQLGMIRYRAKYYKDARHYFQLAARLYPESPSCIEAYRMMGECSVALNDYSNAQYAFAQVRKLGATGNMLADAMFQEGIALYHLGRFRSSAERFNEYLGQFPSDRRAAQGYVWKGEALYQDGKFEDAERAYTDALRLAPNNPKREDATYGIAWTLFEQKKFSQAAGAFERFSEAYPGSSRSLEASIRKADCYFFTGQYDKASALYASLTTLKTESRTVEYAAFQLAMSYIQRGETDRGIDHLRNFLASYPNSIYSEVVQFNIAWTFFSKDQYNAAIPEFRTLLRLYPQSQLMPRVLFNTGDAFFNLKMHDSARVYYQRVIREYPTSPLVTDALAGLQYTYEAEGRPALAAAQIDSMLRNKPEGVPQEELLLRKGDIFFSQGDFASAITEYQHVLTLKPDRDAHAKTLHQLGRAYELQNNPARAIPYYQQVLADFSDTESAPAVALGLGLAHIKTQQYRAAITDLKDFEKRYPDSPLSTEARYQLGVAHMSIPDYPPAIREFQTVIQLHPENVLAEKSRLNIARIHAQQKDYSSSIDTLTQLVTRRSDDIAADALNMIGENYAAMKKYREALQAYNDVIQQYTEFQLQTERAHLGLAKTYEKMNDRKLARAEYQKILKAPVDPAVKYEVEQRLRKLRK
jgi:TolA-binding protein